MNQSEQNKVACSTVFMVAYQFSSTVLIVCKHSDNSNEPQLEVTAIHSKIKPFTEHIKLMSHYL